MVACRTRTGTGNGSRSGVAVPFINHDCGCDRGEDLAGNEMEWNGLEWFILPIKFPASSNYDRRYPINKC